MTKTVLFATAAVLALSVGGVASAAKPVSVSLHHAKAHSLKGADRSAGVLYDQSNNDSGIGIVSQNFESSFDIYDAAAADDFTVPKGSKWKVTEVDAFGVYFNGSGPARDENVTFYKDDHGAVGDEVKTFTAAGTDNFGSFAISLGKKGVKLKKGTYWVSVQANLDFSAGGEWGWENQTSSEGNPAQWENPGDGFGTGCTSWSAENVCIPDGQGDHMFTIRGTSH
jgi:hypothetical protein